MALVASTEAPIIEVSHVSTRFGTAVVHRDVSLTVVRGEVFAIAGGNGCGKSSDCWLRRRGRFACWAQTAVN